MVRTVTHSALLLTGAIGLLVANAGAARAQDLQDRAVAPPPVTASSPPAQDEQIQFTSDTLEYESESEVVTAKGDVRLSRDGQRLRADSVTWNRVSGKVVAEGNIAVVNPQGDTAYGDRIELTDTLRD